MIADMNLPCVKSATLSQFAPATHISVALVYHLLNNRPLTEGIVTLLIVTKPIDTQLFKEKPDRYLAVYV